MVYRWWFTVCSFPSSSLGMRYQKFLLLDTRQARACKARVPKLELGNQRKRRVLEPGNQRKDEAVARPFMAGGKGLSPYGPCNAVGRQPFADLAPKKNRDRYAVSKEQKPRARAENRKAVTRNQQPEIRNHQGEPHLTPTETPYCRYG